MSLYHKYYALEIQRINNWKETKLIEPTEGDKPLV